MFYGILSPGFGLTPTEGTAVSAGENGSVTCAGQIDGHTVTGPGSFGLDGHYTDSTCLTQHSSGTYTFTVPTDAGPLHKAGTFSENRLGLSGSEEVTQPGAHGTGSYLALPMRGDCVTAPVTGGTFIAVVSLSGDSTQAAAAVQAARPSATTVRSACVKTRRHRCR